MLSTIVIFALLAALALHFAPFLKKLWIVARTPFLRRTALRMIREQSARIFWRFLSNMRARLAYAVCSIHEDPLDFAVTYRLPFRGRWLPVVLRARRDRPFIMAFADDGAECRHQIEPYTALEQTFPTPNDLGLNYIQLELPSGETRTVANLERLSF